MAIAIDSTRLVNEVFAESPEDQSLNYEDDYNQIVTKNLEIFTVSKTLIYFIFKVLCLIVVRYLFQFDKRII